MHVTQEQRYNYLITDIESSSHILKLVSLEYIKEDSNLLVEDISETLIRDLYEEYASCNMESIPEFHKNKAYIVEVVESYLIRNNFVTILSAIFMDNIFYYIKNSSISQFLDIVNSYKFPYILYVRNLYIENLVTFIANELYIEKDMVYPIVKRSVLNLLSKIYSSNKNEFNQYAVMTLEEMTNNFNNLKCNSYFFQIDNFNRLVLIFR